MSQDKSQDDGVMFKLLSTGVVLVLMVPGLIIEPTPISEAVGGAVILGIWGLDSEES